MRELLTAGVMLTFFRMAIFVYAINDRVQKSKRKEDFYENGNY